MPRVFLNEEDRACHRLASWVKGEKDLHKLNDTELGKDHGISQEAMSRKLRVESFDFRDFVYFVRKFGADDETLHYILGIRS